jgi:predicted phage terminase large subunit-like protein
MPPRHGKSELVSRHFPAWCLGKNPDEEIIACSYSADLAAVMGRDVQRVMNSPEYQELFGTRLASSLGDAQRRKGRKETEREFEVVNGSGRYFGAGVGGPITGKGMTLGIVDDPIKNQEEADSERYREKVWGWYTSTFLTRGEGGKAIGGEERIVVCLTPWHEDDLAGRILKQAKEDGEEWVVIRFPAVKEDEKSANCGVYTSTQGYDDPREPGEALWPGKFDRAKLAKIEAKSARTWNALYQCRPSPEQGNIFKRSWWKWYSSPDELPRFHAQCFTLDAAFKDLNTSSYVVLQLWGVRGPDRYLLKQWRGHYGFEATKAMCRTAFREHPKVITKLIEEKANGAALIESLGKQFPGIVAVKPKDPKHVRAYAVQGFVQGGNVYLPDFLPEGDTLVEEAAAFPFGKFDDQVDAMVQFLLHYQNNAVSFLHDMVG